MSCSKTELVELREKIIQLENTVNTLKSQINGNTVNKDGLPIDLEIYADVENIGKVWLCVNKANYQVKQIGTQTIVHGKRFRSLSAAAEFFSNIKRKSGWVYWHTTEGSTLKQAYKG